MVMLSKMEALNSVTLCGTTPSCARTHVGSSAFISRPSSSTRPREGSYSRVNSVTSVDLPAPEAPTTATHSPATTDKLTPRRAVRCGLEGYAKCKSTAITAPEHDAGLDRALTTRLDGAPSREKSLAAASLAWLTPRQLGTKWPSAWLPMTTPRTV